MNGIAAAGYFLFSIAFGLLTFVLWLRFILRFMHVGSLHPINQVILKITNPIIMPINKMLPDNHYKRIDIACLVLLTTVCIIKFCLIGSIFFTEMFSVGLLITFTIADLIVQPLNLLFYAVIIRVIISWINPNFKNPLADLLTIVTEPILGSIRRHVPIIAGFDFAPLIAVIGIKVITITIGGSLPFNIIG